MTSSGVTALSFLMSYICGEKITYKQSGQIILQKIIRNKCNLEKLQFAEILQFFLLIFKNSKIGVLNVLNLQNKQFLTFGLGLHWAINGETQA